jgi:hypothetical protein
MLRQLRPRSIYDVMAAIACFGVLAGGTAYAADTIRSTDIVDGEVKSADVANQDLTGGDIKDNSISSFDVASLVGDDIVDSTVTSADIKNDSLTRFDIGQGGVDNYNVLDNTLTGQDVQNGGLNDEDIAQPGGTFVNFLGSIGVVAARSCVDRRVSGVGDAGDHVLLEPNWDGSDPNLSYGVEYSTSQNGDIFIHVCNPTNANIDDSFTRFNLLVIDAQ